MTAVTNDDTSMRRNEMNRREFLKNAALAGIAVPGGFHLLSGNAFAQSTILIGFSQALMNHPHRVAMAKVNET